MSKSYRNLWVRESGKNEVSYPKKELEGPNEWNVVGKKIVKKEILARKPGKKRYRMLRE